MTACVKETAVFPRLRFVDRKPNVQQAAIGKMGFSCRKIKDNKQGGTKRGWLEQKGQLQGPG